MFTTLFLSHLLLPFSLYLHSFSWLYSYCSGDFLFNWHEARVHYVPQFNHVQRVSDLSKNRAYTVSFVVLSCWHPSATQCWQEFMHFQSSNPFFIFFLSITRNGSLGLRFALRCLSFISYMLNVSALPTRKWKKLRLLRVTSTLKETETVFNTSDMNHWSWPC